MQNPTPRANHCEAREKGRRVKLWQLNCAIAKFLCYQNFTGFAYWHDATYRTKRENSINLICLTAQKQDKSVSEFLLTGWLLRGKPFCPFRCARTCPNGRVYRQTHTHCQRSLPKGGLVQNVSPFCAGPLYWCWWKHKDSISSRRSSVGKRHAVHFSDSNMFSSTPLLRVMHRHTT